MFIYLQMTETPEDRSKFEQIYDKYLGLMYHIAHRILGNREDTEDAVHQAFVSIAENIKKIHPADCPKTKSYIVITVERKVFFLYTTKEPDLTIWLFGCLMAKTKKKKK